MRYVMSVSGNSFSSIRTRSQPSHLPDGRQFWLWVRFLFSFSDVQGLILRMLLGVPHSAETDEVHNGYFIPAGTAVFANIWFDNFSYSHNTRRLCLS